MPATTLPRQHPGSAQRLSQSISLPALSGSVSSLLPAPLSPTSSSILLPAASPLETARALYARAARAFLQRAHVPALLASEAALASLLEDSSTPSSPKLDADLADERPRLLERTLILRLTLFATLYAPASPSSAPILASLPESGSEATRVRERLELPPARFLAASWNEALQAYHGELGELPRNQIEPSAASLRPVLDLPAGVVCAAIMGALRVDETSATGTGLQSKKEASSSAASAASQQSYGGLKAARDICEWVLAAHSAPPISPGAEAAASSAARREQHSRVLELYALHVLGARAGEWDYAEEMIRMAMGEVAEREALLHRLFAARDHLATRPERRRVASEAARKAYEEERERRAVSASAAASAEAAAAAKKEQSSSGSGSTEEGSSRRRSMRRMSSSSSVSGASASGAESDDGGSARRRPSSSGRTTPKSNDAGGSSPPTPTYAEKPAPSSDFSARRENLRETIARNNERDAARGEGALVPRAAAGAAAARTSGVADLLAKWMAYVRSHPLVLVRWLGALLVALAMLRGALAGAGAAASARVGAVGAGAGLDRKRIAGERPQTQEAQPGLVRRAAGRLWDTLRMGTQVTYL